MYNGEFDRGERYGNGVFTQPGGWSYEGQWMHGLKDGRGKMTYENGDVYEGTWIQDMVFLFILFMIFKTLDTIYILILKVENILRYKIPGH